MASLCLPGHPPPLPAIPQVRSRCCSLSVLDPLFPSRSWDTGTLGAGRACQLLGPPSLYFPFIC